MTQEKALVPKGGELALSHEAVGGALARPADIVAQAVEQADCLMAIVEKQHLYVQIGKKKFLQAEAWQLISRFNLVSWDIEWIRPVMLGGEIAAYEAKANLLKHGEVVGSAIMSCGLDDDVCKSRTGWDKHKTAMSAAETWAGAKASRMKFAWVAVLAGYEPTPAEEMIRERTADREAQRTPALTTAAPMGVCPKGHGPFVHKTGVAKKTGKPYDFWGCAGRNPDGSYCQEKPPERQDVDTSTGEVLEGEAAPWPEGIETSEEGDKPMPQAGAIPPKRERRFDSVGRLAGQVRDLWPGHSQLEITALMNVKTLGNLTDPDAVYAACVKAWGEPK